MTRYEDTMTTRSVHRSPLFIRHLLSLIILIALTGLSTLQAQTNDCNRARPLLLAPSDEAEGLQSPVAFEWSPVDGADGYRLSIVEEEFDIDVVAETTLTTAATRLAPGTFGWFVEAFFDDCQSTVSDIHVFDVARAENCADIAPILLSPTDGSEVTSPVTFVWTSVPGAIAYEVSAVLDEGEPVFVGETSSTSLTAHLGDGHVTWMVDAEFNGCDETESEQASFDIPADPACAGNAPLLLAPAYGATDVPTRVDFVWTPVDGARSYTILLNTDDNDDVRVIGTTSESRLAANVPGGPVSWAVIAEFETCPPRSSPISTFGAASPPSCSTPVAPEIYVDPRSLSGDPYVMIISPGPNTALYEVEEATREDFSNATSRPVNDILLTISHEVSETTRFYYRVRSLSSCGRGAGPWSATARVVVSSPAALTSDVAGISAPYGKQSVTVQRVRIPGSTTPVAFSARADQPWITVSPSSGIIPPEGIDLTLTARPQDLPVGTSSATVIVEKIDSAKNGMSPLDTTVLSSIPVSVSLVTPVSPDPGNSPLPGSLIIPAVAHAEGIGVRFESDIRIANTSAQVISYLLSFTGTGTDGTRNGQKTNIQVAPGTTVALNDVLRNFYGFAAAGDRVSGVLEIRPLTTSSATKVADNVTVVTSRTFAVTAAGTLGQFIPAIRFSSFIGMGSTATGSPVLSLQQIAQSAAYRTNIGLIEASGKAASVLVTVFGDQAEKLGQYSIALKPAEHMQLNGFLQSKGLSVNNGRIEVSVVSPTGRVTAYASVLDNRTDDPQFIPPVDLSKKTAARVVLPGMADLADSLARWKSDIRLFNGGAEDAEVSLMFIPMGSSSGVTKPVTVKAGHVVQIDNALQSFFSAVNQGGSVVVTTPTGGKIVATARTYRMVDGGGTYGQFIPGISSEEGVANGERALQILNVEESERFRTNLGIVELTGAPVTVEVVVVSPGLAAAPVARISLQPNEFRQLNRLLHQLGLPTTYNGRITLRVVGGSGRVSGYASLIDNRTGDPTYIPAQ